MKHLRFSPGGELALIVAEPFRLLHPSTLKELAILEGPYDKGGDATRFSPDATRLAIATGNHTALVWDLRAIRYGLAEVGLDWKLPAYPPAPRTDFRPLRVKVLAAKAPPKEDKEPPPKK